MERRLPIRIAGEPGSSVWTVPEPEGVLFRQCDCYHGCDPVVLSESAYGTEVPALKALCRLRDGRGVGELYRQDHA